MTHGLNSSGNRLLLFFSPSPHSILTWAVKAGKKILKNRTDSPKPHTRCICQGKQFPLGPPTASFPLVIVWEAFFAFAADRDRRLSVELYVGG